MKKLFTLFVISALLLGTLSGCNNLPKITVGATSVPHAEILESIKDEMRDNGYNLVIKIFGEYDLLNPSLKANELDANFFQHQPYLDSFNAQTSSDLEALCAVHFEPLGIYSTKITSLDSLEFGAKILVPNDPSNRARALLLLEANGIITLSSSGLNPTLSDVINSSDYQISEVSADLIPATLSDATIGIINGNYALGAGLEISRALATESADSASAQTYANIVAVRKSDKERPDLKLLAQTLQSQAVKAFITESYDGAVVAVF